MDTLFLMRAFVCVTETGSFTAAANRLDLTTSYVSRAVSTLEDHLHTRLLHRTTRRLALTEAGQRYLQRCEDILSYIAEAEAEASQAHACPAGTLKMHAMTGIGHHYLIRAAAEYGKLYPDVNFDLTLANRTTDILDEGYDVSVIIARTLPDSGYISRHLGEVYSVLCAAPDYIEKHGLPTTPEQLNQHRCLRLVYSVMRLEEWTLYDRQQHPTTVTIEQTHFQVNTVDAMTEALKAGLGVGAIPLYACRKSLEEGSLIRVLPEHTLYPLGIYALYPSRQYLDAKTRTWLEFLRDFLAHNLKRDEHSLQQCNQMTTRHIEPH